MYKAFYTLLVSLVLLISCTKETIEVLPGGVTNEELKGKIAYKFNGNTHLETGVFNNWDNKDTVMIAICESETDILRIYVYDTLPGTYNISTNQTEWGTAFITYFENKKNQIEPYRSTSGTVELTIQNGKASGVFNAQMFKSAGSKNATVTDGAFREVKVK